MTITVAGVTVHTVHELNDLWKAYQFEISALQAAMPAIMGAWTGANPAGAAALSTALSTWQNTLPAITARVQTALGSASASTVPSWDAVACVDLQGDIFNDLVDAWAGASIGGQGFNAIDRMVRQSGVPAVVAAAPSYQGIPQPTAPDFDLATYQLADSAAKWLSNTTTSYVLPAVVLIIGLLLYSRMRR